jgi:hypothetical protein
MQRYQQQLQLQYSQNILETVTEKCFHKCIVQPSSTLSTNDKDCLQRYVGYYLDIIIYIYISMGENRLIRCMDRFVEAMNLVGRTLAEKNTS